MPQFPCLGGSYLTPNNSETGGSDLIHDYSVISESIKHSRQLGEHPGAAGMRFPTPHQLISARPSWVPAQGIKILLLYHLPQALPSADGPVVALLHPGPFAKHIFSNASPPILSSSGYF